MCPYLLSLKVGSLRYRAHAPCSSWPCPHALAAPSITRSSGGGGGGGSSRQGHEASALKQCAAALLAAHRNVGIDGAVTHAARDGCPQQTAASWPAAMGR
jgi:hypothetical protein